MKIRRVHANDGTGTVEEETIREVEDMLAEEHGLDLSAAVEPLTISQRRAFLAGLEEIVSRKKEKDAAFDAFLRFGIRGLTEEQREQRAQSTDTTGGGYLIPAAFEKTFIAAMKQFDPILDIATNFETPTGAAGDFPIDDDTTSGAIVAESGTSTAGAVTFASLPLVKCPQHRSNLIRVPLELLQDAFTTFAALIQPVLARRLARSVAATAVAKLLTDADVAVTSASAASVLPSEVLDLMAAVDPAHAAVGSFLMNESSVTALRKQTAYAANNFPNMFGTDPQGRTTVFGKPVFSSPSMSAIQADGKAIAFGNFKRFYVRTVTGSLVLKSFPERYAEYGQSAFEMYWRAQGALAKSTNTPAAVRLLACHS